MLVVVVVTCSYFCCWLFFDFVEETMLCLFLISICWCWHLLLDVVVGCLSVVVVIAIFIFEQTLSQCAFVVDALFVVSRYVNYILQYSRLIRCRNSACPNSL